MAADEAQRCSRTLAFWAHTACRTWAFIQCTGHSRGGKVSVLTAALDDRVTALCLLDPVDNTKYAPLSAEFPSAVEALKRLAMQVRISAS